MPIKAVLFDLDNTLVDFLKMKKMSCEAAITAMIDAGLPLPKEKAMRILWDLYDKYGIEYSKIFQQFLTKTLGSIDWKILASGIVAYRSVKTGFLEPYPHVMPTLLKLKERGYRLGVVSDAPRMKAWLRLAAMHIADFFDLVVTIDDADGKAKPNPAPYKVALKKLGLDPGEVIFVGDNPNRDILGAKKLGIRTVLAKYGEWTRAKEKSLRADYEINDVKELLKILGSIK
jgi:putative hydrolase of the HAD superfamily